jgi:hypothetical protein
MHKQASLAQVWREDIEFRNDSFMAQVKKICNEEFPGKPCCFYYLSFEKSIK